MYSWKILHDLLNVRIPLPEEMRPSYNVAPSQTTPVCRMNAHGQRELVLMRWGFTPRWSKDGKPGPINARSETVATTNMFRAAYKSRRCLVPISGFYEWTTTPSGRRPHYIHLLNDEAFCLAGIWEQWGEGEDAVESFAVLTTTPNDAVAKLHDRMPVIVRPEDYDAWLSSDAPPARLFEPYPAEETQTYPVSTRVNSPRHDEPGLCVKAQQIGELFTDDA